MISFSYPPPGQEVFLPTQSLTLRHDPNEVSWTYTLNTQSFDTYGGQVIQVLSVNINSLIIQGQLGREGPFGVSKLPTGKSGEDPRWGGTVPDGGFVTNDVTHQSDYAGERYPGMYAMTRFFREYFSVSGEGGDPNLPGKYVQTPMIIRYENAPYSTAEGQSARWVVTPNNFPMFKRSNENFAPEWSIECAVIEAPPHFTKTLTEQAVERLQSLIRGPNEDPLHDPFSDPNADPNSVASDMTQYLQSAFRTILPAISQGDILKSIAQNISTANVASQWGIPTSTSGLTNPAKAAASSSTIQSTSKK